MGPPYVSFCRLILINQNNEAMMVSVKKLA